MPVNDYIFTHKDHMKLRDIKEMYHDVVSDGTKETLFYDNGVFDEDSWMQFIDDGQWLVQVSHKDGRDAGMFWLNGFQGRTAQVHFCVRRAFEDKVGVGQASMEWIKKQGYFVSLYGCTPKPFRHALKYIQELGFKIKGELPGACYIEKHDSYVPGIISVLDLSKI